MIGSLLHSFDDQPAKIFPNGTKLWYDMGKVTKVEGEYLLINCKDDKIVNYNIRIKGETLCGIPSMDFFENELDIKTYGKVFNTMIIYNVDAVYEGREGNLEYVPGAEYIQGRSDRERRRVILDKLYANNIYTYVYYIEDGDKWCMVEFCLEPFRYDMNFNIEDNTTITQYAEYELHQRVGFNLRLNMIMNNNILLRDLYSPPDMKMRAYIHFKNFEKHLRIEFPTYKIIPKINLQHSIFKCQYEMYDDNILMYNIRGVIYRQNNDEITLTHNYIFVCDFMNDYKLVHTSKRNVYMVCACEGNQFVNNRIYNATIYQKFLLIGTSNLFHYDVFTDAMKGVGDHPLKETRTGSIYENKMFINNDNPTCEGFMGPYWMIDNIPLYEIRQMIL